MFLSFMLIKTNKCTEKYLCRTLLTVNMDEIRIPFDITKRVDLDRVVAKVETNSLFGR